MENCREVRGFCSILYPLSSIFWFRMSFPPPNERQARMFWVALTALAIAVLVGVIVLFVWGLGHVLKILSPVLWPLAVAGVVAYLLDPLVDYFARKGFRRTRAIIAVFTMAFLIVAGIFVIIVPPIVNQTHDFVARIPEIKTNVVNRVEIWATNSPAWLQSFLRSDSKPTETPVPTVTTNATTYLIETNAPAAPPSSPPPLSGTLDK